MITYLIIGIIIEILNIALGLVLGLSNLECLKEIQTFKDFCIIVGVFVIGFIFGIVFWPISLILGIIIVTIEIIKN